MPSSRIPDEILPMLQQFSDLLRSKLPHNVLGLYIQGSIALNGFNKNRSDIDFIVILKNVVTDQDITHIEFIHEELRSKHKYYLVTEGQYTTLNHLNKSIKESVDRYPKYFYGERKGATNGFIDNTSLWILKNHGMTVFGPEVHTLNIAVEWQDILDAMKYNLHVYWADKASNIEVFFEDAWIDDTVLTLGRIVYTLENKIIITKDEGGYYLLKMLPSEWHRLVKEALRIRQGLNEVYYVSREERATDVKQLIKYITDLCNDRYKLI